MTAFDQLATTYDADFTESPIARWLRARTHARLDALFQPGDTVLELGCGTGEDALHLARRGVRVVATDSSEAMLDAARAKTADEPQASVKRFDLNTLVGELGIDEVFDGTYSNFGALNCVSNRRALAAWLAARIKPGGAAAFGIMSPLCLWELFWHSIHGNFRTATRRLRGQSSFQMGGRDPMPIYYPAARHMEHEFAPSFRRLRMRPLGLFLPPSDTYGVIEKRPRLMRQLIALETHVGQWGALARFADHYWMEMERTTIAIGE